MSKEDLIDYLDAGCEAGTEAVVAWRMRIG